MIIKFPEYRNGVRIVESDSEIDVDDYIKRIDSLDAFRQIMFPSPATLERIEDVRDEVKYAVRGNDVPETLEEHRRNFLSQATSLLCDYDYGPKHHYKGVMKEGERLIKRANVESTKYVTDNHEAIYEMLDAMRDEFRERQKNNKKEVNKRYYEKRKQMLGIRDKVAMSEEERREKKRLANQKYREKQKQLNATATADEEPNDEPMTEKEKKRKYNQTYYSNQKQLKERVKELEAELARCKEQA
jgi:hypothetical protein